MDLSVRMAAIAKSMTERMRRCKKKKMRRTATRTPLVGMTLGKTKEIMSN